MSSRFDQLVGIAAWQAIGFGTFLLVAETFRNWGAWPHWASYAFDYAFAVCLLALGLVARRGAAWPIFVLIPLWLMVAALFTWSFLGHLNSLDQPTYGAIPHLPLTIGIGVMAAFAVCAAGTSVLALILRNRQRRS